MQTVSQQDRLGVALAGRYRIVNEIGGGAMATVYRARDLKYQRDLAMKVLKPDVAACLGRERFLREIEIAAQLNHPHILTLIDSGEAGGFLYYVMPFVEGESLRARLDRDGQMPIEDTLRMTEQVAAALDYAHRQDIIHRDIKPENILVHEGEALLADFGIALAVRAAGADRLTATGISVGTLEYMSPEQATGERELDARSDEYSLACVAYEMLTGEPPYTGPTALAILGKCLTDPVPSARRLRETIPASVDAALRRALAKAPIDRFATTAEFATALRATECEANAGPKSIVVLPIANLSPDPDNEFFADGLTEELIAELSKVQALRVISRTSAMVFKGAQKSIPSIARQLDVRYALEGTVRRAGDSVRITAQLIEAATDTHLWAGRYTDTLSHIFDLQERLARQIAGELQVRLTPDEERRLAARPIGDHRARDMWLQVMQHGRTFSKEGIDRAIKLTNQALAMVGDNALLYAALGYFYWGRYDFNISHDDETLRQAEHFAAKALALGPDLGQAHFAMGLVKYKRGDMQGFVRHAKRAWELDRGSDASSFLGFGLAEVGRIAEARRYADDAVSRDPLVFTTSWARTTVDLFAGRFDDALARLRRAADELAPGDPFAGWWLAQIDAYAGNDVDARTRSGAIAKMNAGFWSDWCAVLHLALSEDRAGVRELLGRTTLRDTARTDEYYPLFLSNCLARVGEHDEALMWLTQAVRWGFTNHEFLSRHNRLLEPLRGHAQFQALIEGARRQAAEFEA